MGSTGAVTTRADKTLSAWTPAESALIKTAVGADLTVEEFKTLLLMSAQKGLNPLNDEIWPVKYGGKTARMVLQTSIEGYIKIANKTGKFGGFGPATVIVRDKEGTLREIPLNLWDPDNQVLVRAVARVIHRDYDLPQEYSADYSFYCKSYDGKPNNFWDKGPLLMLYKCAQAVALRRTFPAELSNLYTEYEMEQAQADVGALNVTFSEVPDPTKIVEKWATILSFLVTKDVSDEGLQYAESLTLRHFGVDAIAQINNLDALTKWARKDLLIELQQENFLPMARK